MPNKIKAFCHTFSLNHIIEGPWIYSGVNLQLYEDIIGLYYKNICRGQLAKHGLDIDPFKLYFINPQKINKRTGRRYNPRIDVGKVCDGDWDNNVNDWRYREHPEHVLDLYVAEEFEKSAHYKSMFKHFEEGVSWENTELYHIVLNRIQDGHSCYHGCESEDDLKRQLQQVDSLFQSIREDGYKTQLEIVSKERHISMLMYDYIKIKTKEIIVDIGRDGEFYFVEGRHRLTIAKLLELDEIPVLFLARHKKWVDKLADGEIPSHPDRENIYR